MKFRDVFFAEQNKSLIFAPQEPTKAVSPQKGGTAFFYFSTRMAWKIFSSNGAIERCEIRELTYTGTFMGERCIVFTFNSPHPVSFEIGDYLTYRGERFELNYIPSKEKVASSGSYGEAFKYADIKFNSLGDELTRCNFLDYVKSDNLIHYSGLSNFSFYASNFRALAERILVNLDRIYSGPAKWTIDANPAVGNEEMSIDINNMNCFEALSLVNEKWDLFFTITGRTIKIGYPLDALPTEFTYKGEGLYSIKQDTKQDTQLITRLRAFGSTKNMPYRYYNGKGNVPESMYCPNLMLPGFTTSGGDIFIESPNKSIYGIREATVYFDGSGDNEEIYPTLANMTADRLLASGTVVSLPFGDNRLLDEVLSVADMPSDNGVLPAPDSGTTYTRQEFKIILKDLGFDINNYLSTQAVATISMTGGMCISREFEIVECQKDTSLGYTRYILTCLQEADTDINIAFPNNTYTVKAGDKFVLLNIQMPEVYIKAAEQKLYEAATEYLSKQDTPKFSFEPRIWRGYFPNRQPLADSFIEGKLMPVKDTDLDIQDSIPIQVLTIKEGDSLIPQFEVTLSEDMIYSRIQKIQNKIDKVEQDVITGLENITKFTKRRWRDLIETQQALKEEILSGFTEGISPLTIQAMQGFFGHEQLQYVFVNSKTSPQSVISVVPQYNNSTGVLTAPVAILKHMTIGADNNPLPLSSSHDAAEHRYWDITPALNTNSLPTDILVRLYIKCDKNGTTGQYVVSDHVIALEEEPGYYNFLMGYLTTDYDGDRSWVSLYGFTEILPGQITTDIIQDPSARLVIDLVNATITALNGAKIIGSLQIQAGSTGYENLTDIPNIPNLIDTALNDLMFELQGIFRQGIINETGINNIKMYLTIIANEKARLFAEYTVLYNNPQLDYPEKGNLYSAYEILMEVCYWTLYYAINNAISDSVITQQEMNYIESCYDDYRYYFAEYEKRYEEARAAIEGYIITNSVSYSTFNLFSNQISGTVTQVSTKLDGLVTQINSAGWITTAYGNTLWASIELENGNKIISYINQNATTTTINAAKIDLLGQVTFQMLHPSAQAIINGKLDGFVQGGINTNDLLVALNGQTIISGGLIQTSLINTQAIFASYAYLGGFTISNNWLTCNANLQNSGGGGFIDMQGTSTRILFGWNLIPDTAGSLNSLTAHIQNGFIPQHDDQDLGVSTALRLRTSGRAIDVGGNNWITVHQGIAIDAVGGIIGKGCYSFIKETAVVNDSITYAKLRHYDTFVFLPSSQSGMDEYLPTREQIFSEFAYFADGMNVSIRGFIRITIFCMAGSPSTLRIRPGIGGTGTPLLDNNGASISQWSLGAGDVLELGFWNGAWYTLNHQY